MNKMDVTELELMAEGRESRTKQSTIDTMEKQRLAMKKINADVEISRIDDEIANLKMKKAARLKELKAESKTVLAEFKNGFRVETKDCYKVPDFEDRMMRYYDDEGNLFDERPLLPSENQYAITNRAIGDR